MKKRDCKELWVGENKCETSLTSDHDSAKLCQSQGVDNTGTLWLHQVFHHQQTQELHVSLYRPSVDRDIITSIHSNS